MNISHFLEDNRCKQIIVVTKENEIEDIKKLVSDSRIEYVFGGQERQDSVYEGLQKVKEDYVFIHDGARPFITEEILERGMFGVQETGACVVGMPSKDTVKLSDEEGYVKETPNRKCVWTIQTPQIFLYSLIREAHDSIRQKDMSKITDDAMVVEQETGAKVALAEGSYQNIKITTPEDLDIAEAFLKH